MVVTINDPTTLALLSALKGGAELYTPDGLALGRFEPPKRLSDAELAEFGLTREKLEAIRNSPNSEFASAEEVAARLKQLRDLP